MHSALLVIQKPSDDEHQGGAKWERAMAEVRDTLRIAHQVEILAENTLLIPARSDLSTLSLVIGACLKFHLSYKVLFLDQQPQWVLSPDQFHGPQE